MTPSHYYAQQITQGMAVLDVQQQTVLATFDDCHKHLIQEHHRRQRLTAIFSKPRLIPGIYLWGSVGCGKTFLMDCFYQSLPFANKRRSHFHQFMQFIHHALTAKQGEADPLAAIAKEIAKDTLIICLDEFLVTDITDAMLLARLIKALFQQGVCLVATSNTPPDDLYKNGLQRISFLPAIKLIKEHTKTIHLMTATDYRLRHLTAGGVFFTPDDEIAESDMEKIFQLLTPNQIILTDPLIIHERAINIVKQAGDVIWFQFNELCSIPRSQADYLVIAKSYKTLFLSNIPQLPANAKNTIRLFIRLIDVLYDARIRLIFSSNVTIDEIYQSGDMISDFKRTRSRLIEMQSEHYFQQ